MKKLFTFVVLTGAGLGIAGCGDAPPPAPAKPATPAVSPGPAGSEMPEDKGGDGATEEPGE